MSQTIGLCMIVKDEAEVILRCLESVRPIADYVLIVDTGSSDDTIAVIEAYLKDNGLAGEVIEHPWVDFAHNRTFALDSLRRRTDVEYALIIDADEVLTFDDDFDPAAFKAGLTADLYNLTTAYAGVKYPRPQLFRNRLGFRFDGVLHEFLVCPEGELSRGHAKGLYNVPSQDGARSRNPQKYDDDAEVLRKALKGEHEPWLRARYQFYLAQSLRDAGRIGAAIKAYATRAAQGHYVDEVFYSFYQVGRLSERAGRPAAEVVSAYLDAFNAMPARGESLHALARYWRLQDKFQLAYAVADIGRKLDEPAAVFCAESWVYDYGLLDEFAVSAYWIGAYRPCLEACDRLLANPRLPEAYRPRIAANRAFAADKLGGGEAA
jgi:glycosyltransferase involved in cell wall biosynthesis